MVSYNIQPNGGAVGGASKPLLEFSTWKTGSYSDGEIIANEGTAGSDGDLVVIGNTAAGYGDKIVLGAGSSLSVQTSPINFYRTESQGWDVTIDAYSTNAGSQQRQWFINYTGASWTRNSVEFMSVYGFRLQVKDSLSDLNRADPVGADTSVRAVRRWIHNGQGFGVSNWSYYLNDTLQTLSTVDENAAAPMTTDGGGYFRIGSGPFGRHDGEMHLYRFSFN